MTWEVRIDLVNSPLQAAPGDCVNLGAYVAECEEHFGLFDGCGEAFWLEGLLAGIGTFDGGWPAALELVCLAERPEFVPEPGSLLLLGGGLASLAGYAGLRWRARPKSRI
jgi:hypothetical protein